VCAGDDAQLLRTHLDAADNAETGEDA
jgi:hypothetical protein